MSELSLAMLLGKVAPLQENDQMYAPNLSLIPS